MYFAFWARWLGWVCFPLTLVFIRFAMDAGLGYLVMSNYGIGYLVSDNRWSQWNDWWNSG